MPTSPELENLVRIGKLKTEPPSRRELEGLRKSGEVRLADARNPALVEASRFDLAYNAAQAPAPMRVTALDAPSRMKGTGGPPLGLFVGRRTLLSPPTLPVRSSASIFG